MLLAVAAIITDKDDKLILSSNGIIKRNVNSFQNHCSFSYNMRYNIVGKWTWDGYKLFSTISLCVYLLQGPPDQFLLGMVIIPLEALPQFLVVAMNCTHWDGPYRRVGMDFFMALVDIPLSVWYLTFYPDETTKYVVVAKILVDSIYQTAMCYGSYVETYLYFEKELVEDENDDVENTQKKNRFDNRYCTYFRFTLLSLAFLARLYCQSIEINQLQSYITSLIR